jgi:putative YhdH/YhfP family quinone oxidoreductase
MENFKALVTEEVDGKYITSLKEKAQSELPEGDVLIKVEYSSLNFKDGLSSVGNKGVTRKFPHTPGIDAAGRVASSDSTDFAEGDEVIVTGYDLGMNTDGGFAEYIRVPAGWVVKKPDGLTLREAMIYGTAGFTAALSVIQLEKHGVTPEKGKVLVTGATGGVGSVAVAMLAGLGFDVVAATGRADKPEFLNSLGAAEVIDRKTVDDDSGRPMLKGIYAGAVDTVGGNILATAVKSAAYGGAVTTCGLTQSAEFSSSVFPFILRGVSLIGIDSVELPIELKREVWDRIASDLKIAKIEELASEISLEELIDYLPKILKGETQGRVVVKI